LNIFATIIDIRFKLFCRFGEAFFVLMHNNLSILKMRKAILTMRSIKILTKLLNKSNSIKRLFILFIVLLFSTSLYSQLFKPDSLGLFYYQNGSELIKLGDFKGADSILSLALCSYKNENVYFNRAVSRLYQNDTVGYCEDMGYAANKYNDLQAAGFYNHLCCSKVDTIFYDKKHKISGKQKYRYYEIIKHPKFDSIIYGSVHDIKTSKEFVSFDYGCENNLLGFNTSVTDIIAGYIVDNDGTFYYNSPDRIFIFNSRAYKDLKRKAKMYLSSKYPSLMLDDINISVYFRVYFNSEGEVVKVHYEGIFPEINFKGNEKELEKDLLEIVKRYPKVKPARLFNKKIGAVVIDFVEI